MRSNYDGLAWSNAFAVGTNSVGSALSHPNGTEISVFSAMSSAAWNAASIVPSAFSIQVMNPSALQTTSGMIYIGRCKNKMNLAAGDLNETWGQKASELVGYSNPRLCSASKLAMQGVQVDAIPGNMSELSNFTSCYPYSADFQTSLNSSSTIHQEGFQPIFLFNPDEVPLQVLVCCEWRVRFDPSNPAYSSHRLHKPSTDASWFDTISKSVQLGSGVVDIVSKVASLGAAE
jgi:hypothetical protein